MFSTVLHGTRPRGFDATPAKNLGAPASAAARPPGGPASSFGTTRVAVTAMAVTHAAAATGARARMRARGAHARRPHAAQERRAGVGRPGRSWAVSVSAAAPKASRTRSSIARIGTSSSPFMLAPRPSWRARPAPAMRWIPRFPG